MSYKRYKLIIKSKLLYNFKLLLIMLCLFFRGGGIILDHRNRTLFIPHRLTDV